MRCGSNDNCDLSEAENKRICSKCRLVKCQEVGMTFESKRSNEKSFYLFLFLLFI